MTRETMATQEDTDGKDDAPLIDLNEATIKKLITKAKRRGYVTVDELNEALPQDELSSEQIEDVMSAISEMGVNIVENDEDAEAEGETEDEVDELSPDDEDGDDEGASNKPAKPAAAAKKKKPSSAPTIRCGCTCAKWARSNCSAARAKLPSPSASRLVAT